MKKIVLIILVAMVPFLTVAQKRSKKSKNVKIEKPVLNENKISVSNFMVIVGKEAILPAKGSSKSKLKISIDFGGVLSEGSKDLLKLSNKTHSMIEIVNAAAGFGWDFVSSNVILSGDNRIHYYYMKKK